ncbi:MAG: GLUG motif-containing protein [Rhizomicrobium sp.]
MTSIFVSSLKSGASVVALSAVLSAWGGAAQAGALPNGGHFVSGKGTMGKAGQSLTVKQSSTTGIIDWNSFSIGKHESVTFDNRSGATLNRVTGANLSRIAGWLHATGSLYLLNSSGAIVSGTGRIVTGGNFVVSSGNIGGSAFGGDERRLRGAHAIVVNRGSIVSGGNASLVGGSVKNIGTIAASSVVMRATHGNALGAGTVTATGTSSQGAHILLIAANGRTKVTGDLVARNANGSGGSIETSGRHLSIAGKIDAGKGGAWLVDPVNLTVDSTAAATIDTSLNAGTNVTLKTAKKSASGPGNQSSGAGDIVIDSALSWSGTAKLTLDAYHSVLIDAAMSLTGKGKLALLTDDGGTGGGLAFGAGNVTFANTSSTLTIDGSTYTLVNSISTLASDIKSHPGKDYALAADYDASGDNGGDAYAGAPITKAFTGIFEGLGNTISNLSISSGNISVGLFATIDTGGKVADLALEDVSITSTSSALDTAVGALAATNNGTVDNVTVSGSVTATGDVEGATTNLEGLNVGGLVGINAGTVKGSVSSAVVTANNSTVNVGGLIGYATSGSDISQSWASGAVTSLGPISQVGGLVGVASGSIEDSYASGSVKGAADGEGDYGGLAGINGDDTIFESYATGTVTGGDNGADIGGLLGVNFGTVSQSYATGAVTSGGSASSAITTETGGLVGANLGMIAQSYATGTVSAGDNAWVGGLVGGDADAAILQSYSTGAVSAGKTAEVGGFVGDNDSTSTIDESYSFGKATGGKKATIGGFAGENHNASGVSQTIGDYYNKTANASEAIGIDASVSSDIHGLGAAAMFMVSSYAEWTDFGMTPGAAGWVIADLNGSLNNAGKAKGGTLPMLLNEYSTTIANAHQLQLMQLDVTANYTLAADIDASSTAGGDIWGAAGFIPIGGNIETAGYTGVFDGANHTIDGLFIDYNSSTKTGTWAGEGGLFGFVDLGGVVENVGVTNASVTVGIRMNAGILVGNLAGTVVNSYSSGSSTTGDADPNATLASGGDAGGLVGAIFSSGTVDDSYSSATVISGDSSMAGGLVGGLYGGGTVENSSATGDVTGGGDNRTGPTTSAAAGGLIGLIFSDPNQAGTIAQVDNDFATGAASVGFSGGAGGLVGAVIGAAALSQDYATGAVTVGDGNGATTGYSLGGGLVGVFSTYHGSVDTIDQSYATGSVTGGQQSIDGGFTGDNSGTITNSFATGSVFAGGLGANYSFGGGFAGYADIGSWISTSYSTGAVTGTAASLGGFAGADNGTNFTFKNDYWDTATSGFAAANGVGGVSNQAGVKGLTTKQLKSGLPSGFKGAIWANDPDINGGLPYLKELESSF